MAVLIGFRVNRAYERWWEGRILWGTLVNVSRNLAVKVRRFADPTPAERRLVRDLIVRFAETLRVHLQTDDLESGRIKHPPSAVVNQIYALFADWSNAGRISDQRLWIIDREARVLLDVCGACERIKNTLMSSSWRYLTRQCIVLYLLILPWGLIDDFAYWTIPMVVIIAYLVISAEAVAHYVERPFGETEDHLDLDAICTAIDRSVSEILSVDDAPAETSFAQAPSVSDAPAG